MLGQELKRPGLFLQFNDGAAAFAMPGVDDLFVDLHARELGAVVCHFRKVIDRMPVFDAHEIVNVSESDGAKLRDDHVRVKRGPLLFLADPRFYRGCDQWIAKQLAGRDLCAAGAVSCGDGCFFALKVNEIFGDENALPFIHFASFCAPAQLRRGSLH